MFTKPKEVLEEINQFNVPFNWAHFSEISESGEVISQSEIGGLDNNIDFLIELFIQTTHDAFLVLHRTDWLEVKLLKKKGRIYSRITIHEFPDGIRKEKEVNGNVGGRGEG